MSACRNCRTTLVDRYCPHCGQKDVDLERPILRLLGDVLGETFELDGRVARTLRALFFSPGRLTAEFLAGRRQRYTPPFRLYLGLSLLFFLVAAWTAGQGFLLVEGQTLEADAQGQARFVGDELPKLMFVLLPVFAAVLKLAHWQRLYFDHLIHALHLHSAAYVILMVLLPLEEAANRYWPLMVLQLAMLAGLVLYFGVSLKRVYGGGWVAVAVRAAAVLLGYMMLVGIVVETAGRLAPGGSGELPFITD